MEQYPAPASPPVRVFKRVSKACRRCRRLRTKCTNQGVPPCEPCRKANHLDCSFPARGEPDADRAYRQPRSRADRSWSIGLSNAATSPQALNEDRDGSISVQESVLPPDASLSEQLALPSNGPSSSLLGWESLPPYDEVIEGVQSLTTSFFQLGFLPKTLFFEGLRKDRNSVNFFLLFSILSVSARFTPSLVKRYHGGANATRVFLTRAACFVPEQMFVSNLESIQAFFLMSIAEWGNGDKNRSLVLMGISIRLAGILRLHREETYRLPATATNEEVVYSEVARRTFWMLETFENLHSGSDSPIAFSYNDITVLLPCDEREFTFGIRPFERAALSGTPPADLNPSLTCLPSRSLFATLLQTHSLWGRVARLVSADAMQLGSGAESKITPDDYGRLSQALVDFERDLPQQHTWSTWNLRAFKIEGLDLAYLSAVMVLRLSNIILRRSYLHDILNTRRKTMLAPIPIGSSTRTDAWSAVADQLFDNMLKLHEQITAFFEYRSPEQGYPALIVFCVYVCGSLAKHLHRQPHICPRVAVRSIEILQSSIGGLVNLQAAWPFARRWYLALCKASEDLPMEIQLPTPNLQDDSLPNTSASHHHQQSVPEATSAFEIQFNDPLPSDSIFGTFDMHLWNGVIDGCEPFDDPNPVVWRNA